MSFTSEIKDELFEKENKRNCCKTAELGAYINNLSGFQKDECGLKMVFICEDIRHTERISKLLNELFGANISFSENKKSYKGIVESREAILRIIAAAGAYENPASDSLINPQLIKRECCKKAYLRTCFLINGFVTDPQKNYHMEFSDREYAHAYGLKTIINSYGIPAKIIERKNRYVVYIKDSEQIADLLNIMSAHLALLKLENIKVYKEVRNDINRKNNCETSNIAKTIKASVREQKAIERLSESGDFKKLSPKLKAVAEVRLNNPDLSYAELGKLLSPPLGKSGVYHRLQKLVKIAETL